MAGYHLKKIKRGTLGCVDKVEEEFLEFCEAIDQGSVIMALIELSDLIGAILRLHCVSNPSRLLKNITHGEVPDWHSEHLTCLERLEHLEESVFTQVGLTGFFKKNTPTEEETIIFLKKLVHQIDIWLGDLFKFEDFVNMAQITKRAFESGARK